jgi:predicted RNase H-like nuclease (RuvC/YqgF family)
MRIRVNVWVLGCALVCLAAGSGFAQNQSSGNDTSLGAIARQIKAQKAKEPKPVRVMTNDTLAGPEDKSAGAATDKKPPSDAPPEVSSATGKHDAEYFRSQQTKLQDRLETDKRELAVLQQKLGINGPQYYANPQDSLMQQYTRSDINKLTDEINAKKQKIEDDQKAIDDLHEQLRREGGDPSWLRQ